MTVLAPTLSDHDVQLEAETHEDGHHDAGSMVTLGFWIYLMSDCILFACLFATFTVLRHATAGGPSGHDIFDLPYVAVETGCLLVSSFTYGMAMLAMNKDDRAWTMRWLAVTMLLGMTFIGMEIHEFAGLVAQGFGPDRSGFLSAFFTLVGTHGLHVTAGIVWMAVLMIHLMRRGLNETNRTRLMCLSLFWHFLAVIWIGVFTVVYLMGVAL